MFDDLIILNLHLLKREAYYCHVDVRPPWKQTSVEGRMVTAATHLACVARSQSMGNGIPGLQKRKKRIMKWFSFIRYIQPKGEGT